MITNLELQCEGIDAFDLSRRPCPTCSRAAGSWCSGAIGATGHKAVRLRARRWQTGEFVYETRSRGPRPSTASSPTIWAQRKVAVLLDEIRLHGQNPELVEEVRRLGKEFGIVTPFTSHLMLEDGERVAGAMGQQGRWRFGFAHDDDGAGVPNERQQRVMDELTRPDCGPPATPARGTGQARPCDGRGSEGGGAAWTRSRGSRWARSRS